MSLTPIIPSIESNNKKKLSQANNNYPTFAKSYTPSSPSVQNAKSVSFTGAGFNPIVSLMDFIDAGGYAASFIIQDGIGFIAPRVGKGLLRGGEEKKDENGNVILDKNGQPEHHLNWAYARKEGIREIVTGPSAFLIPMGMLAVINKYCGTGNSVKLNYIDGFKKPFESFVKGNLADVVSGNADKRAFYQGVLEDVIERSVNGQVSAADKMSVEEIKSKASEFADKQLQVEAIKTDKTLKKKERAAKLAELGSVESDFMKLMKNKVGGTVNETAALYSSSSGKVKAGGIGELLKAMKDYFGDAVNSTKKVLAENVTSEQIEEAVKGFTNRRMGSRVLTNLGIFGTVAMFYTQIPKLYNWGLKGNPALAKANASQQNTAETKEPAKKDVTFTGMGSFLEKTGSNFFNGKVTKGISDMFELNGPIISGTAMPALLYGFCIPPRLIQAQDKYDYQEIMVRDMTAFTALLFGAKALSRLFSDGFTKLTGLALNSKNMAGRNVFQKAVDYLNPNDTRHSVLSSVQLNSKYTNIDEYKGGVSGFMDFIEGSGGNVKKAFARDSQVKAAVEDILREFNGKSYKEATALEIKNALKSAATQEGKLTDFYKLFKGDNGLLRAAKTCNSSFGFLSTLVLVPGLIIWLTDVCQKLTEKRLAEESKASAGGNPVASATLKATNTPTMAGFINNAVVR